MWFSACVEVFSVPLSLVPYTSVDLFSLQLLRLARSDCRTQACRSTGTGKKDSFRQGGSAFTVAIPMSGHESAAGFSNTVIHLKRRAALYCTRSSGNCPHMPHLRNSHQGFRAVSPLPNRQISTGTRPS